MYGILYWILNASVTLSILEVGQSRHNIEVEASGFPKFPVKNWYIIYIIYNPVSSDNLKFKHFSMPAQQMVGRLRMIYRFNVISAISQLGAIWNNSDDASARFRAPQAMGITSPYLHNIWTEMKMHVYHKTSNLFH